MKHAKGIGDWQGEQMSGREQKYEREMASIVGFDACQMAKGTCSAVLRAWCSSSSLDFS